MSSSYTESYKDLYHGTTEAFAEKIVSSQKFIPSTKGWCGAIVRSLIRNGHSAEVVPVAFHVTSTKQSQNFLNLLYSTGMIRVVKMENAVFLIDSFLKNGVWELRLLRKNGSVVMKKTVRYRSNP